MELVAVVCSPDAPVLAPARHAPKTDQYSLPGQLAAARRFFLPQLLFSFFAGIDAADLHVHKKLHHHLLGLTACYLIKRRVSSTTLAAVGRRARWRIGEAGILMSGVATLATLRAISLPRDS